MLPLKAGSGNLPCSLSRRIWMLDGLFSSGSQEVAAELCLVETAKIIQ